MATPYLEKNVFGLGHTKRVYDIAKQNFRIDPENETLTLASIILHDIGGSTIKEQYERGPKIAADLLSKLGCSSEFVRQVCEIISTHHEHPDNPSEPFRILYDSDKIVMFSKEEFPHYNSRKDFDWTKIVAVIYSKKGKRLAEELLSQRRKEHDR